MHYQCYFSIFQNGLTYRSVNFLLFFFWIHLIFASLTLNSQPTARWLTPEQGSSNTHFLHQAHHSLPALGHTWQHFHSTRGGHLKRQNHQQKAQTCAKYIVKRMPVYNMRNETGRQSAILFDLSWERAHQGTQNFLQLYMCPWSTS